MFEKVGVQKLKQQIIKFFFESRMNTNGTLVNLQWDIPSAKTFELGFELIHVIH
jgi:hypothetical protein